MLLKYNTFLGILKFGVFQWFEFGKGSSLESCFFYKKFIQTVLTICWQVAEQYSEDKARQGGNLGWQTRGQMVGFVIIINVLTITVGKLENK